MYFCSKLSLMVKKPIIISGSPRSGSTWIGRVLEVHPDTRYVHEPFNIGIERERSPFKYWMEGVFVNQNLTHLNQVEKYLKGFYTIDKPLVRQEFKKVKGWSTFKDFLWILKERRRLTTIIKDPIAYFALEWLSENISNKVIITIRHPAAVVASLKQKRWGYDFSQMLKQPELMDRFLKPFEKEIELFSKTEKSLVEQGALLWKCVYSANIELMKSHKDWLFVKNEDLSLNPMGEFTKVFKFLEMPFDKSVIEYVKKTTTAKSGEESLLVRDSKKNVDKWKSILNQEEISFIKENTKDIWKKYYTEKDW